MDARRNGQGGTLTPGNVVKCFCALVVTVTRSVGEIFMHYFHNLWSASGGFQISTRAPSVLHPWTPVENFRLQIHNLPTPWKIVRMPMLRAPLPNSCRKNVSLSMW